MVNFGSRKLINSKYVFSLFLLPNKPLLKKPASSNRILSKQKGERAAASTSMCRRGILISGSLSKPWKTPLRWSIVIHHLADSELDGLSDSEVASLKNTIWDDYTETSHRVFTDRSPINIVSEGDSWFNDSIAGFDIIDFLAKWEEGVEVIKV